ncbi:MAG: hypothetical protein P8184_12405 [Calditrichia bacterium]
MNESKSQNGENTTAPANRRLRQYLLLAREFESQNLWNKAVHTLEQAVLEYPNHPVLLLSLSETYNRLGARIQARQILEKLLKSNPGDGYVNYSLAVKSEREGKFGRAWQYYLLAIKSPATRAVALKSCLTLLLQLNRNGEALNTLSTWKKQFKDESWFVLLWCEALVRNGQKSYALRILSRMLKENPDKYFLIKYVSIKYQQDHVKPQKTYQRLLTKYPGLPQLKSWEFDSLEVDYLIHHSRLDEAEKLTDNFLGKGSNRGYWIRRSLDIKEAADKHDEFEEMTFRYLMGNPSDTGIFRRLERYFTESFNLTNWMDWLRLIFIQHPLNPQLFKYLRTFFQKRDWLQNAGLRYHDLMTMIEKAEIQEQNFPASEWIHIPQYVYEYFCLHLNFADELLPASKLFELVCGMQGSNPKLLPFTEEDLRRAYPAWIMGLQFYFLFKEGAAVIGEFNPAYFYNYRIALILKFPKQYLALDVSELLNCPSEFEKEWLYKMDLEVVTLPAQLAPHSYFRGMPVFELEDLPGILSLLDTH